MAEYIEKRTARPDEFCVGVSCQECPFLKDPLYGGCRVDDYIMALPPADVRPVVHCRDCKFWHDAYVEQNDGTKRKYREDDVDPLGIKNSVTLDKGINYGAICCVEDGTGWDMDKRVFRQADDFCSRGELRPCSYDAWWGIVDGVYPKEDET